MGRGDSDRGRKIVRQGRISLSGALISRGETEHGRDYVCKPNGILGGREETVGFWRFADLSRPYEGNFCGNFLIDAYLSDTLSCCNEDRQCGHRQLATSSRKLGGNCKEFRRSFLLLQPDLNAFRGLD